MAARGSRWKARRLKHRDALAMCILSSAFMLAGELANPNVQNIVRTYLAPYFNIDQSAILVLNAILAGFAFTTAFGAILVLVGGSYFSRGKVPRGRFFVGLGVGLTSLSLANRVAYAWLVQGSPLAYLSPLATSPTGIGILIGVAAHTAMGQYALLLKKHARQAWRRFRRTRRSRRPASRS